MLILLHVLLHYSTFGNAAINLPFNKNESVGFFNFTEEKFCTLICTKLEDGTNDENVGCHCNKNKAPKTCKPYRTDQLLDFRKLVLTLHNELRQKIASGDETNPSVGQASNMNAVSYDLGLEFAAMCTSMKCIMEHDHCRRMQKFRHVGQNLYFSPMSEDAFGMKNRTTDGILLWYNELKVMPPTVVDSLVGNLAWGHFTAMMWAQITHIGCAITSNPKPVGYAPGYLVIMVTCHYGVIHNTHVTINMQTKPVYQRGPPATACPKGTTRNSIFSALCGEIEPIPIGKLVTHPHHAASTAHGVCVINWVFMILVVVVFLINN